MVRGFVVYFIKLISGGIPMRRGTICGYLRTKNEEYFLVHPKPIEPDSRQHPEQQTFLVTHQRPLRIEKIDRNGVFQDAKIFGTPFHVTAHIREIEIVLDGISEVAFEDAEEIE